jgi:GTPase
VRSLEDVYTCARHIHSDALAPVFLTSSVTGDGLELVRAFFNLLPQRQRWADRVRLRLRLPPTCPLLHAVASRARALVAKAC